MALGGWGGVDFHEERSNDTSKLPFHGCLDDKPFTIVLVQAMGCQRQGSHHTNSLTSGDTWMSQEVSKWLVN